MIISWEELTAAMKNFTYVRDRLPIGYRAQIPQFWDLIGINYLNIRETTELNKSDVPDEVERRVHLLLSPHLSTILRLYVITKELK